MSESIPKKVVIGNAVLYLRSSFDSAAENQLIGWLFGHETSLWTGLYPRAA